MSHSCTDWRGEIGAYIVGALDGRTRSRVSRHLLACDGCRADYDDLVPVRTWLGRLDAADAAPGPRAGPESGLRPAPPPATRRRAIRPRTRTGWLAAGTALVAAAATLAGLAVFGPVASSFDAVDNATGVSGRAELHRTPAGTEIDLTASGLRSGQRCVLVAVAQRGADIAGTWDATYDGSARMAGTTAFPVGQLTALRIESDTGHLLLTIRV